MYPVSSEYKEQMAKQIRNPSYMRISYGIYNLIAQNMAALSDNGHTAWSDMNIKDTVLPESDYVTFETNRWAVGSNQSILPETGPYQTSGFISTELSGSGGTFETNPVITITFETEQTLSGLTLWFDTVLNTYPKRVKINGTEYYPDSSVWSMDDKIEDVSTVTIEFIETEMPYQRARLNRIGFGRTVSFGNADIIKTSYQSTVDLISCELPKKTFSFTIKNLDHVYDPINTNSLTDYIDVMQPIDVDYGYELDNGSIYWIRGDHLVLNSNPKTSKWQATFSCVGALQNMTQVFNRGVWVDGGKTLWDLAIEVLEFAGVDSYVLDEHMKDFICYSPLPVVECNKLLQIIANASMCFLQENRDGYIEFKYAPYPQIAVADNGHVDYSFSADAFNREDLPSAKNASFYTDGWRIGDDRYVLMPSSVRARFVSSELSGADGTFSVYPVYSISFSYPYEYYEIPIVFDSIGGQYAVEFDVVYLLGNEEINRVSVADNSDYRYTVQKLVTGFDLIQIEIHKWSKPNARAVIDRVDEGRINDFYLNFHTSQADPNTEKIQQSKTLEVVSYSYTRGETGEIYSDEFDINGEVTLNVSHDMATDMSASVTVGSITYQSHYAERSVITVSGTGKTKLTISGTKIVTSESSIITQLNDTGVARGPMTNPLVCSIDQARKISAWIENYYKKRVKLTVSYRGNPELDADDLIYTQSQFADYMPTRITKTQIDFNGALSGKVDLLVI